MATGVDQQEYVDSFDEFFREYYRDEIGELARNYPSEQKSLFVDWDDLYRYDRDIAEQYLSQPEQLQRCAEEALRVYDLPIDVSLGQAHVRIRNIPDATDIRELRAQHVNDLVAVKGIVRKATDVRPKCQEAAFRCVRCETLTRVPQDGSTFQEPHECRSCERQGPFQLSEDQSTFVDAQRLRVQESPEGLRGGETPQAIDIDIEDDVTGEVTPGDHVTATGILRLDQSGSGEDSSPIFDVHMEGISVQLDDEEFEDMDITEADKEAILELASRDDVYEEMIGAIAPSIHGYDQEKLAMTLQLFSGVTKHLPDESRIRGDLHILFIGDPGTGKCVSGDTTITLGDGTTVPIREFVESNLDDPTPVDDGVYDTVDVSVPSMAPDGTMTRRRATKVWKREAPERMYRIRTSSGREVEVTPSHPLFVQSTRGPEARRAAELQPGDAVAAPEALPVAGSAADSSSAHAERSQTVATDGGVAARPGVTWDRIESIEPVEPDDEWVYDLEVEDTHSYVSNGLVSHNSQLLQYVRNIAPRSVYTSGKGSSSAGLTAAAVRDDFGDGQQWTLEAGALVLADQGVAAVDELDKMRCVTGDTLVHLGDGRVSQIRDLALEAAEDGEVEVLDNGRTIRDVDLTAWTMTDDGQLVQRPVTAIHEYEAPSELTEVGLESGEALTSTPDHPYFVFENGKRVKRAASELSASDWVYVPESEPQAATDGGSAVVEATRREPDADGDVTVRRVETVRTVPAATDERTYDRVYDLTVEETHNFVANGMVVHNSEDRSAMHEALEQQSISISKAGINATLKSRCSLLGAANPIHGRFDQYEPMGEQIDLEPALISRFDLIFTVTDEPDPEDDAELAEHILEANYAGQLNTQRQEMPAPDVTAEEVQAAQSTVEPTIEPDLLRKYVAYAQQNCYPRMTDDARHAIRDFYVDLRSKGADEDAPVPVTARKLEALVRLAEASARVRLADEVEVEDAERVIEIVRSCLQDIGVDPETGEFDADIIETGTSKTQRDRIKNLKALIDDMAEEFEEGVPVDQLLERADEVGIGSDKAEQELEKLKQKGEVYEPRTDHVRTT